MISPKEKISRRWYRIDATAGNILEVYTGKPKGVTTHFVGFDNCTEMVDGTENPLYGNVLPDSVNAFTFPNILVEYYITVTLTPDGESEPVTYYAPQKTINEEKIFVDANGKEYTESEICNEELYTKAIEPFNGTNWLTEKEGAALFTKYLWLDDMIEEGHATQKRTDAKNTDNSVCDGEGGGPNDDNVKTDDEQYLFIYKDPDNSESTDTYWDKFSDSVYSDITAQILNGRSWDEIKATLPYYLIGSGVDDSGYTITVSRSTFQEMRAADGEPNGHSETQYIVPDIGTSVFDFSHSDFKTGIINKLNEKVKECRDNIAAGMIDEGGPLYGIIKSYETTNTITIDGVERDVVYYGFREESVITQQTPQSNSGQNTDSQTGGVTGDAGNQTETGDPNSNTSVNGNPTGDVTGDAGNQTETGGTSGNTSASGTPTGGVTGDTENQTETGGPSSNTSANGTPTGGTSDNETINENTTDGTGGTSTEPVNPTGGVTETDEPGTQATEQTGDSQEGGNG